MTTRITMDEWLAAIQQPEPTGHTTKELAKALGYSEVHFRMNIRSRMIEAGILRKTGFQRTDGANTILYELVIPKDARKRLLNVGVAIPPKRRGGRRDLSSLVAQLANSKK